MIRYALLLLVIPILLIGGGCTSQTEVNAILGQEFTLGVGQVASVADEDLKIQFVEVTGDSRCPKGAICIWAGEITCLIDITYGGSVYPKYLTQPGLADQADGEEFIDYRIRFDVQPYPQVGQEISKNDYRLQLTIEKAT